jgi:hypothetical protein
MAGIAIIFHSTDVLEPALIRLHDSVHLPEFLPSPHESTGPLRALPDSSRRAGFALLFAALTRGSVSIGGVRPFNGLFSAVICLRFTHFGACGARTHWWIFRISGNGTRLCKVALGYLTLS